MGPRALRWCSFSAPSCKGRAWGAGAQSLKALTGSHATACLCLPFPLSLFFSFYKHSETYIFELGELFILVVSSLSQQMFTYHSNVSKF